MCVSVCDKFVIHFYLKHYHSVIVIIRTGYMERKKIIWKINTIKQKFSNVLIKSRQQPKTHLKKKKLKILIAASKISLKLKKEKKGAGNIYTSMFSCNEVMT